MTAAIVGEWARLLLGSLAQSGVKDVVVSPGSRSTPFTWAAATTAELRCHSLYDERSAAFFALGLARATGEPALLLSTSGSAAANYFPAVVEASHAHVPLLVMTADRPLELQDSGAPQTIDQVKLYGAFARSFFDLGVPDPAQSSLAALQRTTAQAVLATRSPVPGPVHLNARARKPLEPGPAHTEHELAVVAEVDRLLARGVPRVFTPRSQADPRGIAELAARLSRAERGIIVCGPLPLDRTAELEAITALARKLGMPVYAEATSQLRFGATANDELAVDALDWLLRTQESHGSFPDMLLRFGATPVSAGVEQLFSARGATELAIVSEHAFPDPTSSATLLVRGEPGAVARALLERLSNHAPQASQSAYRERLLKANAAIWGVVNSVLSEGRNDGISEAEAVRRAVLAVPRGGLLVLGNSLPVREVDAFVRASARDVGVVSQRGTNGIDGLISGAAGTAIAARKPTLLIVGDVSFAHDLGGLAAARRAETPLALVVIDNDGGRIFEQLPVARLWTRPELAELWLTPPRLAIAQAAAAFGIRHVAPVSVAELDEALASALARPGPSIVEVRVAAETTKECPAAIRRLIAETFRGESRSP